MYDRHIVIDLEFTPVSRKYPKVRKVIRDEIIQIGAVILAENYRKIVSFVTFVRPRFVERITNEVSLLTGIQYGELVNAPDLYTTVKS